MRVNTINVPNFGTPKNMLSAQITQTGAGRGWTENRWEGGALRAGDRMALTAGKVTPTSVARACPWGQRSSSHSPAFHLLFMLPSVPPIPDFSISISPGFSSSSPFGS